MPMSPLPNFATASLDADISVVDVDMPSLLLVVVLSSSPQATSSAAVAAVPPAAAMKRLLDSWLVVSLIPSPRSRVPPMRPQRGDRIKEISRLIRLVRTGEYKLWRWRVQRLNDSPTRS